LLAGVKGSSGEGNWRFDSVHVWSILSIPSDMIFDRLRRREMGSEFPIVERDDRIQRLNSKVKYMFRHKPKSNRNWVISKLRAFWPNGMETEDQMGWTSLWLLPCLVTCFGCYENRKAVQFPFETSHWLFEDVLRYRWLCMAVWTQWQALRSGQLITIQKLDHLDIRV